MSDSSNPDPQYAAPQYAAPQYAVPGTPQGAGGYYGPPARPTNVLAIVSMVASIVGFLGFFPIFGSIAGVVTGHMATKQIAQSGEQGAGMAKAGLIVGYVGLALWALLLIFYFAIFGLLFATAATSGA